MEYIIVLNPGMIEPQILRDNEGFIATFSSYENAEETAEIIVNEPGIFNNYAIYGQIETVEKAPHE